MMGRPKKYKNESERKAAKKKYKAIWYSKNKLNVKKVEFAREVLDIAIDGKINKINKKLDWRHIVTESMKPKNQQNQEKTFVN